MIFWIGSVLFLDGKKQCLLILDAMIVCCDGDVRQVDWSPLCWTRAALGLQLQSPKHSQMIIYEYIFYKCKSMCTWTLWTWQSVCFQVRWRGASNMSWFNTCSFKMPSPERGNIGRIPNWPSFPARQWDLFERLTLSYFEAKGYVFPEQKTSKNSFLDALSWILPWYPWDFGKFCWTCASWLWSPKEILVQLWQPPMTSLEVLVCHWGILLNRLRLWLYAPYYVCRTIYIVDDYITYVIQYVEIYCSHHIEIMILVPILIEIKNCALSGSLQ